MKYRDKYIPKPVLGVLDAWLPNPNPVFVVVVAAPPKLNEGVVDAGWPKLNPVCPNGATKGN